MTSTLRTIKGALDYSTSVGNRPSVVGHLWYAGEIVGNFGIEAEFTAVTHGICTRNAEMPAMFLLEGRERDIHESALDHAGTALGADRFEALCEQGGRMRFPEVVDYSLASWTGSSPRSTPSTSRIPRNERIDRAPSHGTLTLLFTEIDDERTTPRPP